MSFRDSALLALLVHIQAHLDEELSLDSLALRAELTPTHLQRSFKLLVGESPREYVERLRLERAAFRLLVHDDSVLEIALDCGFHGPETFSRAFSRNFGVSPSAYRNKARSSRAEVLAATTQSLPADFAISETKIRRLRPSHLAFVRHVGPYEDVPESLFDRLEAWATKRGLDAQRVWMGLGHDAPGTTAAEKLRFDAALQVAAAFDAEGGVGHQYFSGGEFAMTTHVGPYGTLAGAYEQIWPRLLDLPKHRLIGLPAVEIYRTSRVTTSLRLNVTEICLPVNGV